MVCTFYFCHQKSTTVADNFQIRDVFNERVVDLLANRIAAAYPDFRADTFRQYIVSELATLTYSERLEHITDAYEQFLPDDFATTVPILLDSLLPPYGSDELDSSYDRFIAVTKANYVARHGLPHFDLSMRALYEITQCMTSEWGIRPFLLNYPDRTLKKLDEWTTDPNPHVRRLVSEGSRPHLPWGKKLPLFEREPQRTLALLEKLKKDPSEYVRRSVANHLNDLTKKHPDLVVDTLGRWQAAGQSIDEQRMLKHALRTLLKKGHPGALALLGYTADVPVSIQNFHVSNSVALGKQLLFAFDLQHTAEQPQALMIDYVVYFRKANGQLAPKVFKLTTRELSPNTVELIEKKHSFKVISTRKYYAGTHRLAIQVNGVERAEKTFELLENGQ